MIRTPPSCQATAASPALTIASGASDMPAARSALYFATSAAVVGLGLWTEAAMRTRQAWSTQGRSIRG
jgi:short-subunit dehydrogenase